MRKRQAAPRPERADERAMLAEWQEKVHEMLSTQRKLSNSNEQRASKVAAPPAECTLVEFRKRLDGYGGKPRRRVSAQELLAGLHIDGENSAVARRKKSLSVDDALLLQWAVTQGDVDTVEFLVRARNVSLNEPGVGGLYPIHRAASTGALECLKFLVKNGALINVYAGQDGLSPLDMAVEEGEFDCALYLIENGADFSSIKNGFILQVKHGRARSDTF